ncbi:MAG: phosphoribosylamine--glycine ligase [Patescibacteria group bacterium]
MERVLVIGGGGREHALGWKLAQSSNVEKVYFSPGNGGTEHIGENVLLPLSNHAAVIEWIREHQVTYVVVAADTQLAEGMVDSLTAAGIPCFGPTQQAAKIEWSKAYAKEVMQDAGIPTARHRSFSSYEEARAYLVNRTLPVVIKASGLALGKGVTIAFNLDEAEEALKECMVDSIHGEAGREVVIEEFLQGREFSVHALCDGVRYMLFPSSQDHKRVHENDQGPNTGGMGVVTPLPWVSQHDMERVGKTIVEPLLQELAKRGTPFRGLLYPGLMMTTEGPKVIEFNARFGDPETEPYMRLLESDLLPLLKAASSGDITTVSPSWYQGAVLCVMMTSGGYPHTYKTGYEITGVETAEAGPEVVVFHAGTAKKDSLLVTNGGRVLAVTARGATLKEALERAYRGVSEIHFTDAYFRRDIGKKSLE